jgi:hypothetical protein
MDTLALALFLSVGAATLFTFVAVVSWSDARRMEREAYYKSEVLKKLVESQAPGALEYLRSQEAMTSRKRFDNFKLAGLITLIVGLSLMLFLKEIVPSSAPPVYLVGIFPVAIGAVLLGFAILSGRGE